MTNHSIKKMDIWVAELPTIPDSHVQHGRRPVVIVSNDAANLHSPVITVVPLTSKTKRGQLPTHVLLRGHGLRCASVACCEQVMTLDKYRLCQRMGEVTDWFEKIALQHALTVQLDLAI